MLVVNLGLLLSCDELHNCTSDCDGNSNNRVERDFKADELAKQPHCNAQQTDCPSCVSHLSPFILRGWGSKARGEHTPEDAGSPPSFRGHGWANGGDQWLAVTGLPPPTTMPASPFASRGSERPIQMKQPSTPPLENPTGATGPHAIAARPLLGATRPIDEGGERFTSGCPANTARFNRLDAASAPRGPSEQACHLAPRRPTQPRHDLYLNREQS